MKMYRRLTFGLTAASVFLWTLSASSSLQQGGSPVTPPSQDFIGPYNQPVYESSDELLHMGVHYIPQNPEVHLISEYVSPAGLKKIPAVVKTSFWPTCARPIGNGVLLVAGKNRRTGATIIEVWTLNPPTLSPAETPGAPPTLKAGSVADINPVYSGNEAGKSLVRQAMRHRGVSNGVIIQFDDSRDLYTLNTDTAAMSPIASPDATRAANLGCWHTPLLSKNTDGGCRELVNGGYVYMFGVRVGCVPDDDVNQPVCLMLFDNDKNGTLDAFQTLASDQWIAAYGNPNTWVLEFF